MIKILLFIAVSLILPSCSDDGQGVYPSRNQAPKPAGDFKAGPSQQPQNIVDPQSPNGPDGNGTNLPPHGDGTQPGQGGVVTNPGGGAPGYAGPAPVFVVMGGYKSCQYELTNIDPGEQNIFAAFARMAIELKNRWGFAPEYIFSCYITNDPEILVTTSNSPGQVVSVAEEGLASTVTSLANGSPVAFIGHSMGGWLAMKTAITLINNIRIGFLATLDPISATDCKIPFTPSCRRAPLDFQMDEIAALGQRSGKWINFYQKKSYHLRSSEIPAAHENARFNIKHSEMDTDPLIWKSIFDQIAGFQIRSI